jgi:hypothetical protein
MEYLLSIKEILLEDDSKVVSYSLLLALWFILIVFSIITLRIDKLKLVLKFIILFFKKNKGKDDLKDL